MTGETNFRNFVVFEDDDIIVLNKPSGVLSIQDGYNVNLPFLKNQLASTYKIIWAVHRLDKMTSGLIIFAKNAQSHAQLNQQFATHSVFKNYRAVVHGIPIWDELMVDLPLRKDGDRQHRTVLDLQSGKKAVTKLKVITKKEFFCFLDIFPETGLIHQIRAHLSMIGFPILGDRLYWRMGYLGKKNSYQYPFTYTVMYLHAYGIHIQHPVKNELLSLKAPSPAYFQEFI